MAALTDPSIQLTSLNSSCCCYTPARGLVRGLVIGDTKFKERRNTTEELVKGELEVLGILVSCAQLHLGIFSKLVVF